MNFTTIKISRDDLQWWKECCEKLDMNSSEAFSKLKRSVMLKLQNKFFESLPMPSNYKKPLSNIKIDKCKISIQKSGTSFI